MEYLKNDVMCWRGTRNYLSWGKDLMKLNRNLSSTEMGK
ncbi:hypothetical protein Niako_4319 [Niastella koreensis GR20-10]|uniref:Uncharacterized protein n=1 Tax=Niastella koreensis (strain DSM 17620 / KACC 11465 / NBRC 106392 / GR20-10) TaxID=700598 RepID=G8TFY3_NIAKG|nr:hypothetical protein Niako_4319 [Niastella koreensis GR20-10]